MSGETLELKVRLTATPSEVYEAWLDAESHAVFTGSSAGLSEPVPGGRFSAVDGYIEGTYVELEHPRRIVMRWRTSDFAPRARDSRVELRFEAANGGGTDVTLSQTGLPKGGREKYGSGWLDFYFEPMKVYFGAADPSRKPRKPSAPKARVQATRGSPATRGKKPPKAKAHAPTGRARRS